MHSPGAAQDLATAASDAAIRRLPRQIVFKLKATKASADEPDPSALVVARLGQRADAKPPWRPRAMRLLFASDGPAIERTFVSDVPPSMSVADAAALIAKDHRVEFAQPDHARQAHGAPSDPYYHSSGSWGQPYLDLWALHKFNVDHAWEFSRGNGIVVAVVDSGVDSLHDELSAQMWQNPEEQMGPSEANGYFGDTLGWDFVANDNDPQDTHGHGTHMAGIIGAAENGIGMVGAAPEARIMAVRVLNAFGVGTSSTVAAGIAYAADNGARVIALSSGCVTPCPSDPVVENAVRYAASKRAIVVVSAGNKGQNVSSFSPQNMVDPKPIVVAASDQLDKRESFSNFGELVDVVAPGGGTNVAPPTVQPVSNILSLAATFCSPNVCPAPFLVGDGRFLRRLGTSMSAAYVSGIVALTLAESPIATPESVRKRLFGDATDFGPANHDAMFGWGRVTGLNTVLDLRRYVLARITSPQTNQPVSGLVKIFGAADATTFASYEVSVGAGTSPTTWQTSGVSLVGRSTPQGDLARWNTQGIAAGPWTIRLIVFDTVGGRREARRSVNVTSTSPQPVLVVDVASEGGGSGSVHVDAATDFCDGVIGSIKTCSYPLASGTTVTLVPVPNGLSSFAGWSGACSGIGACTVDVTTLHGVRAAFQGPYRLAVEVRSINSGRGGVFVDPPGTDCGPSCAFTYQPGSVVRLEGFEGGPLDTFSWIEGPCGNDVCDVVMDRDWFALAEVIEFDISLPIVISVPREMRAPAGPITLPGSATAPLNPSVVLTFSWHDGTTGEFLGNTANPTVNLGVGVHHLLFTAAFPEDPNGFPQPSASATFWLIVTDP